MPEEYLSRNQISGKIIGMTAVDIIVTAGVGSGFIASVITLVKIALGAERRRADDWRTAAQTSAEANKVLAANVDKLVSSVEQMAASQREMLALLHALANDRRGAT